MLKMNDTADHAQHTKALFPEAHAAQRQMHAGLWTGALIHTVLRDVLLVQAQASGRGPETRARPRHAEPRDCD